MAKKGVNRRNDLEKFRIDALKAAQAMDADGDTFPCMICSNTEERIFCYRTSKCLKGRRYFYREVSLRDRKGNEFVGGCCLCCGCSGCFSRWLYGAGYWLIPLNVMQFLCSAVLNILMLPEKVFIIDSLSFSASVLLLKRQVCYEFMLLGAG